MRAVLQRLLDARPEARVISIGAALGLDGPRYTHIPSVNFFELTTRAADFDVGIAPLAVDDRRGRRKLAKRALKWARGQRISSHVETWERLFESAIADARAARA